MNPLDLRRGIQLAENSVTDSHEKISRKITSKEELHQVGTIFANSDVEIGQLIADAMERVEKEGVITALLKVQNQTMKMKNFKSD